MTQDYTLCVAPMMDWTDRHCRYFHRLLAPNARLYTEMVTPGALIHGDRQRFLGFDKAEKPVVLQLGGSDAADLAQCARMGEDWGYDEINLNCGCPSPRVQKGRFGACLMSEPELVASCLSAMAEVVSIPVTVKCRIAIDDAEDWPFLTNFIDTVMAQSPTRNVVLHARKALLQGLSPKENREVPPLRYDIAERLRGAYPDLTIVLNGGIADMTVARQFLETFDGVMLGRAAYQNPGILRELQQEIWPDVPVLSIPAVLEEMARYTEEYVTTTGRHAHDVTRHMLGLFRDVKGAKAWRQTLSQLQGKPPAETVSYLQRMAVAC
jgi:tRNA-dihydrouridine synthase A